MQILGAVVIHTEEGSAEEMELRNTYEVNKALEGRLKKVRAELEEVAKARKALAEEKDSWVNKKKNLEEEVKKL